MTRIVAAILLGLVLAVPGAQADKALTVKSLTANDFPRIVIENNAGTLRMCGTYQMKDSTGATVGTPKISCQNLTAAQKTTLVNFIRDDVGLILSANQAEGLEP